LERGGGSGRGGKRVGVENWESEGKGSFRRERLGGPICSQKRGPLHGEGKSKSLQREERTKPPNP